ncbi:integrase, catalytic region, zinc finger, CCHC-type containing protein [Tanacetum coccineum]
MILESVENGPLIWPTIEENGVTRPKKYSELSATEAIQADCDVKATNIILQGLPPEVYALVSNHRIAKELWERIQLLMQERGMIPMMTSIHMMSFLTAVVTSRYPTTNNQGENSLAAKKYKDYTPGASGSNSGKQRTVICYNCKGEGHMSKQCTKPKRKQDDSWFKDKVLLVQAQASGQILHEEELAFLADPGIPKGQAISAMPSSEQSNVVNHSETEITSDSNIIPYSQYVIESQQAAVQNSNSSAQQDALILSVIEQLKNQVVNCTKINLENKSVNDTLTAELERYKEQVKVLKEGQNVDLRSNDNVSDSSAQSVEIDHLKQTLSEHLKEKESLMQTVTLLKNDFKKEESRNIDREIALEKKIKQLDNIVFKRDQSAQTVHICLLKQSRSKMLLKQKDPMMLEKKVNTTPVDYAVLNQLSQDFEKQFVPQTELSAEQAFWSQNSVNSPEPTLSSRPTKVEVPKELPKVNMVNTSLKKLKHHLAGFDVVVKERTTATAITEGSWGFEHTKACFRDEIIPFVKALKDLFNTFNQYLVDELSEVQNVFHQMEQAVEQHRLESKTFEVKLNQVLNENERLLEQVISKDIVNMIVNSSVDNASVNVHECVKCLKLETELLNKKDFVEKEIYDKLFKTHSAYIKHTQEEAAVLKDLVDHVKANYPLDHTLDSACRYTKLIQDLLTNIGKTCPRINNSGEKLVVVTPKNKYKRVRFIEPFTSSGNTITKTASTSNLVSNKPMLSSTGVKPSTSASGSQPSGNTKKDKILQTPSSTQENTVEAHPRKVKSSLKNKVYVVAPKRTANVQHSKLNANSKLKCVKFKVSETDHVAKEIGIWRLSRSGNVRISRVLYCGKDLDKHLSVGKFLCYNLYTMSLGDIDGVLSYMSLVKAPQRKQIGTEFVNQTLCEYYKKVGISHETYVAHSPQQNSVVERRNRPLIEAARTMLIYAKASLFLWAEVVATACYTQNQSIVRLRHEKTPYELLHDKLPDLSFFHVFGALCYPTNYSENLGKLQPKADIGIFIGYAPTKKAFQIYNRRTRRIIETIHVDFDELTAMASEQSSSGPAFHKMTPATISSGLVPKPTSSTPFVPPSRTDWDMLFQQLFDELLTPPPCVDNPAPEVIALIAEVVALEPAASTGLPSSTIVDQDAPSLSNSQTTPKTQSSIIPDDVEDDNHDLDVAHMNNDPFFGIPIPEVSSDQSLLTDSIHTIVHPDHQISEHNRKWTKDHPLENMLALKYDDKHGITLVHL